MQCELGLLLGKTCTCKVCASACSLKMLRRIRRAIFRKGCRVAEAARSDRLGKGALQKIEPLTGVLAKILERKQAIIDRSAARMASKAVHDIP